MGASDDMTGEGCDCEKTTKVKQSEAPKSACHLGFRGLPSTIRTTSPCAVKSALRLVRFETSVIATETSKAEVFASLGGRNRVREKDSVGALGLCDRRG